MIIFNEDTNEGFGKITKKTKKFLISIFGFYPYQREEDVVNFLEKDLGLKIVSDLSKLEKDKEMAIEVYNCVGGGRVDLGHVFTLDFKSKTEARDFINDKISNSDYVNKKMFSDIEFIDAADFENLINEMIEEDVLEDKALSLFRDEVKDFTDTMMSKYSKNEHVKELFKEMKSRYTS
jgi:sorbitol-specific phosphotransferase system component IIBC